MPDKESWIVWERLEKSLIKAGYRPIISQKKLGYKFRYPGKYGEYPGYALVDQDLGAVVLYINAPYRVRKKSKIVPMKTFFQLVKQQVVAGGLEINEADHNRIRFKLELPYRQRNLEDALISHSIQTAALEMQKRIDGMGGIMYRDMSPEEAMNELS